MSITVRQRQNWSPRPSPYGNADCLPWRKLHAPLYVHEGNQAMMACVRSGRNPTTRYLERTHRVSVSWLKEVCGDPRVHLMYEGSAKMAADVYAKSFIDVARWMHACSLTQISDPAPCWKLPGLSYQLRKTGTASQSENTGPG